MYVVAVQRHLTDHTAGTFQARFVDHRDPMARISHSHAAGFCGVEAGGVSDDVVDLRLAEHFVDRYPQLRLAIVKHRIAHGLPGTHNGLQVQTERLAHRLCGCAGIGFHHGFQGSRKEKGVGHTALLHEF